MVVRKELNKKQQRYEAKLDLDKNCTFDFTCYKKKFCYFQTNYLKKWVKDYCDGGLVIVESFYQSKELDTELCNQKQALIENAQDNCHPNRTFT